MLSSGKKSYAGRKYFDPMNLKQPKAEEIQLDALRYLKIQNELANLRTRYLRGQLSQAKYIEMRNAELSLVR